MSATANAVSDARLEQFLLTERAVLKWIEAVLELPDPLPTGKQAHIALRDGILLCKLMQELDPKSIPRIQEKTNHAFKLRENISFFLAACEDLKIPRYKLFKVPDLFGDVGRSSTVALLPSDAMKKAMSMANTTNAAAAPSAVPPTLGESALVGGNWAIVIQTLEALAKIAQSKDMGSPPLDEVPALTVISSAPLTLIQEIPLVRRTELKGQIGKLKESAVVSKIKVSTGILRRQLEYMMNISGEGKISFEKLERGITRFQALVKGHRERKIFKKIVRDVAFREKVAMEILATEKSYINGLRICLDQFYLPLTDGTKPLLNQGDIEGIFCNVETIYKKHKHLFDKFEERIGKWFVNQKIGDIFLDEFKSDVVDMYSKYIENFDYSLSIMSRALKQNPQFEQFIKDARELPIVNGLDLSAFLITPVQRIPRYSLLLRDLLKYTQVIAGPENAHPDIASLTEALQHMEAIGKVINERKRKSESILRVGEIADSLVGMELNLVEQNRYFIKDITMTDGRSLVYLFNDLILFAKKKGQGASIEIKYVTFLPLKDFNVRDASGKTHYVLELTDLVKGKTMQKINFITSSDKDAWKIAINDAKTSLAEGKQPVPRAITVSLPLSKTLLPSSSSEKDESPKKKRSPSTPIPMIFGIGSLRSKSPSRKSPIIGDEEKAQPAAASSGIGFRLAVGASAFKRAISPHKRRLSQDSPDGADQ